MFDAALKGCGSPMLPSFLTATLEQDDTNLVKHVVRTKNNFNQQPSASRSNIALIGPQHCRTIHNHALGYRSEFREHWRRNLYFIQQTSSRSPCLTEDWISMTPKPCFLHAIAVYRGRRPSGEGGQLLTRKGSMFEPRPQCLVHLVASLATAVGVGIEQLL